MAEEGRELNGGFFALLSSSANPRFSNFFHFKFSQSPFR